MGIKEHLRKAMVVLLTVAMVSQQSPVVYAVESYSGSSDNESVETYTNDSNEYVDEGAETENENTNQSDGIFDFFGNFFGGSLIKLTGSDVPSIALSATSNCFSKGLPFGGSGAFSKMFLSYGFLAYVAVIIAFVAAYIMKRTRVGLQLRAVGENPATADAAGINITKYKYMATCIGCMVAGLGGLYYVMDYASGVWSNDAFGDRGWLAIALVIFTLWRPNIAVFASFLFGGLYILYLYIPSGGDMAVKELYKMLPYVVTIIVLILTGMRNKRENQPPESLGLPYFREDR